MRTSTANRFHKKPRFNISCFASHKKSLIGSFNPAINIHPSQLRTTPTPNTLASENSRTFTTTVTDEVIQSAVAAQAQMRASGNININVSGRLNNYVSTIAAGNTLSIAGGGAVNNQAVSLTNTVDTSGGFPHLDRV